MSAISQAPTRIADRRSNRGVQVYRVIKELYLRDDIACESAACGGGCKNLEVPRLGRAERYAVPDGRVAEDFLELFELPDVEDVLFLQSVVQEVQRTGEQRTRNHLRALLRDQRRRCHLFHNEHLRATHVPRRPAEPAALHHARSVFEAARWYSAHIARRVPLVIVSDDADSFAAAAAEGDACPGVEVLSSREFFARYHGSSAAVLDLYDSVSAAIAERREAEARGGGEGRRAGAAAAGALPASGGAYPEHWAAGALEEAVESGALLRGVLAVSRRRPRSEASVRGAGPAWGAAGLREGEEVLVRGELARNRALHGDVVAVELLPESEWGAPQAGPADDDLYEAAPSRRGRGAPAGRVVGVLQRADRAYAACLQAEDAERAAKGGGAGGTEALLAVPLDPRVPKIRIRTRQGARLAGNRFVVRVDGWDATSVYPSGHYVRDLGPLGALDTETAALLVENGVEGAPFGPAALALLPPEDWTVPPEEVARRRDLRASRRVFSIDPPGSQDIDDALSVHELPGGRLELGVHIADVDAFVPAGGLLDSEARSRATTVYLVDRRLNMLPEVLSERLISLRGGVDRLAVSVMWEMTPPPECRVLSVWFGRTVIRSSNELAYQQAQDLLEGKAVELRRWAGGGGPGGARRPASRSPAGPSRPARPPLQRAPRPSPHRPPPLGCPSACAQGPAGAQVLRRRRQEAGALELEGGEMRFTLAGERPTEAVVKRDMEVNRVVAELMIAANAAVAERIWAAFPQAALLRHHPIPKGEGAFGALRAVAGPLGVEVDASSNAALQRSLQAAVAAAGPGEHNPVATLLRTLATRAMAEATYFCTGACPVADFAHYGLGLSFYTHFTSPIRRYADVLVHRTLFAALRGGAPVADSARLAELCGHINDRNRASKQVQKEGTELFLAAFLASRAPPGGERQEAVVFAVRRRALLVFVPRYQLKGPVYLADKEGRATLPVPEEGAEGAIAGRPCALAFDEAAGELTATPAGGPGHTFRVLDRVTVALSVETSRAHRPAFRMRLAGYGGGRAGALPAPSPGEQARLQGELREGTREIAAAEGARRAAAAALAPAEVPTTAPAPAHARPAIPPPAPPRPAPANQPSEARRGPQGGKAGAAAPPPPSLYDLVASLASLEIACTSDELEAGAPEGYGDEEGPELEPAAGGPREGAPVPVPARQRRGKAKGAGGGGGGGGGGGASGPNASASGKRRLCAAVEGSAGRRVYGAPLEAPAGDVEAAA
eukprot:tig00020554_g10867.t1